MFDRWKTWRLKRRLARDIDDINEITFDIDTGDDVTSVTVPLDFSDFAAPEIERASVLTEGADDPAEVACAFLFVGACRQVDLDDSDFAVFQRSVAPMFSGDTSMLRWGEG